MLGSDLELKKLFLQIKCRTRIAFLMSTPVRGDTENYIMNEIEAGQQNLAEKRATAREPEVQ